MYHDQSFKNNCVLMLLILLWVYLFKNNSNHGPNMPMLGKNLSSAESLIYEPWNLQKKYH